ncbi:uncharacterized protein LOC144349924 [Saccoglossus kowalevskii]
MSLHAEFPLVWKQHFDIIILLLFTYNMQNYQFRKCLVCVAKELHDSDAKNMKFLLLNTTTDDSEHCGQVGLKIDDFRNISDAIDLFMKMEELKLLSPDNTRNLEMLLKDIGRTDLSRQVEAYRDLHACVFPVPVVGSLNTNS